MGLFSMLSKRDNKKSLKSLEKLALEVMALKERYEVMTDKELSSQTEIFRKRYNEGESLDDLMIEAFAVCREGSRRVLNMEHFKVQIMGGIALFQGRIAEMKTGEGKTLVETLPAYLGAISQKGVHIVTVNEYLAKRDSAWMGKVYSFLNVTSGVIYPGLDEASRKQAYNMDITYATNNELGFDYLKDNLKVTLNQKVQRELNFAIVDEVDSILIDEARTPLIISGTGTASSELYAKANKFVKTLKEDDFEVDIKDKSVNITESGSEKAERFFGIENLGDIENKDLHHHIQQALKAHKLFVRDNNYIVDKGEVIIVDEFTGRLMIGRRYSDGLHQAIEAKENVSIQKENKTHATITFQNFFRMYNKLSGMTGTAKTEEEEFMSIYNLDVVQIPTNRPVQRIDNNDVIYRTEVAKFKAIAKEVKAKHSVGTPILIGTVTVEKSEELSKYLKYEGVPHNILNAKHHEKEAEIVSQAGRFKAVTIATNMAGRGTDIMLGGNADFMAREELKKQGVEENLIELALGFSENKSEEVLAVKAKYDELFKARKAETDKEKEKVTEAGGLYIIGSERHESRRIDNQLRGRAGRQGDAGMSVFFISLEDDLAKRFGGDTIEKVYATMKVDDDMPLSMGILSNRVEHAQKVIEGKNFAMRKTVLEYDNVMNMQREVIYGERNKVLEGKSVYEDVLKFIEDEVEFAVGEFFDFSKERNTWDKDLLNKKLEERLLNKDTGILTDEIIKTCDFSSLLNLIKTCALEQYNQKRSRYLSENLNFEEIERRVLLRNMDDKWVEHIDDMDMLRRGISLRAYAQQDPVIAYKSEAYDMFDYLVSRISQDTARVLLKAEFSIIPQVVQKEANTNRQEKIQAKSTKVVGRNDPCPCGSGRKYKSCCGS